MSTPQPHQTATTAGLAPIAPRLESLAETLGVKSILVMRSEPDSMVVAATAGEATKHYTVGAAGKKALDDAGRVPLYCEKVVDADATLFVRDSREDGTFAGNEDETEFGLHNYLGLAVHDGAGNVVGTVCVLDDSPRDYTDEQQAELKGLRAEVEKLVGQDGSALS